MVLSLYAAVFALMFMALSFRTIKVRRENKVAIGDGGNEALLRASRVHGNFAEYTPFALLLIFILESQGAHHLLIHALCLALLAGRTSHALGVRKAKEDFRFRVFGMAMTFTTIGATAIALLVYGVGLL